MLVGSSRRVLRLEPWDAWGHSEIRCRAAVLWHRSDMHGLTLAWVDEVPPCFVTTRPRNVAVGQYLVTGRLALLPDSPYDGRHAKTSSGTVGACICGMDGHRHLLLNPQRPGRVRRFAQVLARVLVHLGCAHAGDHGRGQALAGRA